VIAKNSPQLSTRHSGDGNVLEAGLILSVYLCVHIEEEQRVELLHSSAMARESHERSRRERGTDLMLEDGFLVSIGFLHKLFN
jgi:hypothetical protein